MQVLAILAGALISYSYSTWENFAELKSGGNFDDSLGIYRISPHNNDSRLFNVSDMIPLGDHSCEDYAVISYVIAQVSGTKSAII